MKAFDGYIPTQVELLALAQWAQAKKRTTINDAASAQAAIAAFDGQVKKLPAYTTALYWRGGRRGGPEKAVAKVRPSAPKHGNLLQEKKARALPMNSYNGIAT